MKPPRTDDYADRRKTADAAKKILLEKFKAGQKGDTADAKDKPKS